MARSIPFLPTTCPRLWPPDRKSTRLNSSHSQISYAVFCLKKQHDPHADLLLSELDLACDRAQYAPAARTAPNHPRPQALARDRVHVHVAQQAKRPDRLAVK